ncbi:hypothetical protein OUZ56_031844 [Daphnia magna]|uniref:Uncharacterized protein n=1 Tax=Daphnia magna TaxID=35525 RepID=A0ABQ9ZVD1_9CRUS|nr:hypothetical protein OUZ56_031844 [Daphnia magna]
MDASGCGNGKYLQVNPSIFKVGSDRCAASVDVARRKDHEGHPSMSPYAKGESQTEIDESIERLLMRAKCTFEADEQEILMHNPTKENKVRVKGLEHQNLQLLLGRVWISESKVYRAAAGFVNNKI